MEIHDVASRPVGDPAEHVFPRAVGEREADERDREKNASATVVDRNAPKQADEQFELERGVSVEVLVVSDEGGWARVQDGLKGWVEARHLAAQQRAARGRHARGRNDAGEVAHVYSPTIPVPRTPLTWQRWSPR